MSPYDEPITADDDFETRLHQGLDRIASTTDATRPGQFDADTYPLSPLSPAAARPRASYLVAAAAAIALIIGLAALQRRTDDSRAVENLPATASSTKPVPVATASTSVTDTTITETTNTYFSSPTTVQDNPGNSPVIPVGTVICVDAGAGPDAAAACAQELSGIPLTAPATSADSFVMPAEPTSTRPTATETVARVFGLDVRPFDPGMLPQAPLRPADVTTYLVLGTNNPYSSAPGPSK